MTIGDRLKAFRADLGWKQSEVVAQCGVSDRAYQGYEAGRSVPGGEAIEAFVRLGLNANWLLTGEGEMLIANMKTTEQVGNLDKNRMRMAIETVEEGLAATRGTMGPTKKAELVLAVYDLLEESGVNKAQVLTLVKLAA